MEASKWANPKYTGASSKPSPTAAPFIPSSQTSHPIPSTTTNDSMDEFAQTRSPDDLFADDFTPMAETVAEVKYTNSRPQQQHVRGARGRGPRRGGGSGRNAPRPTPAIPAAEATSSTVPTIIPDSTNPATVIADSTMAAEPSEPQTAPTSNPPVNATATPTAPTTTTTKPSTTNTPSVRGDRTATGGLAKPKLSETELATRMEAIKLKNASLTAAHERAEADEASFQAREAQAQERRRLERQNRVQMMGEREKNRARKLQAVGGREWDAEKSGDALQQGEGGRGSGFRRGAYGGVTAGGRSSEAEPPNADAGEGEVDAEYEDNVPRRGGFGFRGRGGGGGGERGAHRGGRGGRGGGRGRGGFDHAPGGLPRVQSQQQKPPQSVPGEADFPALPPASTASKLEKAGKGPSWAEEMEDANVGGADA